MDGTLIDSTEAILESFDYAFRKGGQTPPPAESILKLIGLPLDEMFIKLGVERELAQRFVEWYKEHYLKVHLDKTFLLPGAKEAVLEAKEFGPIGVVTTKTSKYTKLLLEKFGILELFGAVIGREDVEHLKPHPEPVLKAMELLNSSPTSTFMIGDTCLDMESAKRAGAIGIGVKTGYWDLEQLKECSPYLVPSVLEGVRLLPSLL
jgi:phosphoglycolate phosphatase